MELGVDVRDHSTDTAMIPQRSLEGLASLKCLSHTHPEYRWGKPVHTRHLSLFPNTNKSHLIVNTQMFLCVRPLMNLRASFFPVKHRVDITASSLQRLHSFLLNTKHKRYRFPNLAVWQAPRHKASNRITVLSCLFGAGPHACGFCPQLLHRKHRHVCGQDYRGQVAEGIRHPFKA